MKICKRYRDLIASYVDDTATAEGRATLNRHLTECEACARATRELLRTRRLVAGLPTLRPSPRLLSSVSGRLRESRVGWGERLWWSFRPTDWRLPALAAVMILLCIGVGIVTLNGPGTTPTQPEHQAWVARAYSPPVDVTPEPPPDDYVTSCVLIHESLDRDRAFGTPDDVQFASYGP